MDDEKKARLEIAKNIFEEVLKANLHQSEISAHLSVLGSLLLVLQLLSLLSSWNMTFQFPLWVSTLLLFCS